MQTSTTLNLDNLSETEKQIILKQREQDKLKAEEKALQRKLETEQRIQREELAVIEFISHWTRQNVAANNYLAQLNEHSTFEAVIHNRTKTFEVNGYDENDKSVTIWSKEVPYTEEIEIKHTQLTNKTIEIKEHYTYSGSGYSSRKTNNGFKMFIKYESGNRATKDPKNMASKFSAELAHLRYVENEKNKKATAQEQALEILTRKYPDATIEHKTEWVSYRQHSHLRRQGPSGYDKATYVVTFKNGYKIIFTYELLGNGKLYISYDAMLKPQGFESNIIGEESNMVNALINAIQNIA